MKNGTRVSVLAGAALFAVATAPHASAQLLVNPSGGTVLSIPLEDDVNYGARALGFTGTFYGGAHTSVDVCSNGFLNFSGDTTFTNGPMPGGPAHINVMWD